MPWVTMPKAFTKAKGGTRDYGVMSASAISYITGAAHKKTRISDAEQIGLVEKETERFATCSGDALEVALRNREQS